MKTINLADTMYRIFCSLILYGATFLVAPLAASATPIPTVPVGDPGNANDPFVDQDPNSVYFNKSYGGVTYAYRIGTTEVTNAQYADFLNAKAASDPLGLYDANMGSDLRGGITQSGVSGGFTYAIRVNMGDKPVNFVNFYDSIRFANWLNNGQGTGDTETGAYTFGALGAGGVPTNGASITRNVGATWFLPSQNEWYKAAYYQPAAKGGPPENYWAFATGANVSVAHANSVGDISNPGNNIANYTSQASWNGTGSVGEGNVTTVGSAGPLSQSFYGTSDQTGNVSEWNDSTNVPGQSGRGIAGSYYDSYPEDVWSNRIMRPATELPFGPTLGFRVASVATVPEPSTGVLAVLAFGLMWVLRKRTK